MTNVHNNPSVQTKVRIRKHERGLLFRYGDFQRVLEPGEHRLWDRLINPERASVEIVSTLKPRLEHALLDVLLADAGVSAQVTSVDLGQTQRALVWIDGRLAAIHGPGRYAYFNVSRKVVIETLDASVLRFEHPQRDAVLAHEQSGAHFEVVDVPPEAAVLLYRNGELVERLATGRHVLFKGLGKTGYRTVDLREKTAEIGGQEIMTADKVTLRVTLVVNYQIIDPVKSVSAVVDADQSLYREAQLALRSAVGTRTLEALLSDKESVGAELSAALVGRAAQFGAEIRSIGLRDVILPGEMKTILNQVIEAENRAKAELIRRREETAAARSQANTARLLAENPVLARIRELELLKEVLGGTNATFVFGGSDVAEQVRSLVTAKAPN